MRNTPRFPLVAAAGVAVTLAVHSLSTSEVEAQQRSRISGTVVDESGNPVEGCVVTAENPTNMPDVIEDVTDDDGRFAFSGVRPGTWTLRYNADGFHEFGEQFQVGARDRVRREVTLSRAAGEALLARSEAAREEAKAANAAMESGDFARAVELYRAVLEKAPELHTIHYNIGLAKDQLRDYAGAAEAYEAFLEAEPENADAMLKLAIALNRAGENERALELYEKVTELQPDSGIAHFNMALMLFQMQRAEKARAAFERALELDPTMHEAHFMLGHIQVSEGDTDAALESYETFVRLAPDSSNAAAAREAIEQLKASRKND